MKNYELMVIFTPVLSNDEYKDNAKNITTYIKDNTGEIIGEDFWGLRSLAYPIEKKTTALYYIMEYQAETDLNTKLQIQLNRNEKIMRHMITSLDKNAIAYNDRKRKGIKLGKNNTIIEKTTA